MALEVVIDCGFPKSVAALEQQTVREMIMTYDHIRVMPLAPFVGAEISGVDLAAPSGEPELAEIRRALGEYGVVFFRDQQLTPEQHIAFARSFGGIDVNRFFAAVPGYPMIAEGRKEPEQQRNIGNGWHTDHSYDEAPALSPILYPPHAPKPAPDTPFPPTSPASQPRPT